MRGKSVDRDVVKNNHYSLLAEMLPGAASMKTNLRFLKYVPIEHGFHVLEIY